MEWSRKGCARRWSRVLSTWALPSSSFARPSSFGPATPNPSSFGALSLSLSLSPSPNSRPPCSNPARRLTRFNGLIKTVRVCRNAGCGLGGSVQRQCAWDHPLHPAHSSPCAHPPSSTLSRQPLLGILAGLPSPPPDGQCLRGGAAAAGGEEAGGPSAGGRRGRTTSPPLVRGHVSAENQRGVTAATTSRANNNTYWSGTSTSQAANADVYTEVYGCCTADSVELSPRCRLALHALPPCDPAALRHHGGRAMDLLQKEIARKRSAHTAIRPETGGKKYFRRGETLPSRGTPICPPTPICHVPDMNLQTCTRRIVPAYRAGVSCRRIVRTAA